MKRILMAALAALFFAGCAAAPRPFGPARPAPIKFGGSIGGSSATTHVDVTLSSTA